MQTPTNTRWIGTDFGAIAGPMLRNGWMLAWLWLLLQIPTTLLFVAVGAVVPIYLLFLFAHCFFIAQIADFGIRLRVHPVAKIGDTLGSAAFAGTLLTLPLLAIAWLSDGFLDVTSPIWLAGYWLLATVTAAPARLAAWHRGARLQLWPIWQRLPIAALASLPFALLRIVPAQPTGECCGLFEGGLFVLPLMAGYLGLYLFSASILTALLSAMFVRTVSED